MNRQQELEEMRTRYNGISPTDAEKAAFIRNINNACASSRQPRLAAWKKTAIGIAAALAVLVAVPNVSPSAAQALGSLPVLGPVFQVVTFRDYQYDSERFQAQVEVPQIINDQYGAAVEAINADIAAAADELIAEFEMNVEDGRGYEYVSMNSKVVCDDERWFTLQVSLYQTAGAGGNESQRCYTIDKTTGQWVRLNEIFADPDAALTAISENIKAQMREQMAADDNIIYWLDDPEFPEANFEQVRADQSFCFTASGDLIIYFDRYEVAPGYMGCPEFTIPAAEVPEIK